MSTHPLHLGHNLKRLREIQGVKQQALALQLGEGWNQKKISLLEARPWIEPELLQQLARALDVPVAAIEGFQEEGLRRQLTSPLPALPLVIDGEANLLEKCLQLQEENRSLYQQLLQAERDKSRLLQKLVNQQKRQAPCSPLHPLSRSHKRASLL
jgi:transcriptional regulator with XRE-family HTH domain